MYSLHLSQVLPNFKIRRRQELTNLFLSVIRKLQWLQKGDIERVFRFSIDTFDRLKIKCKQEVN